MAKKPQKLKVETIKMTNKDGAIANPLATARSLWESKGWFVSPEPALDQGDNDAQEET